MASERYNTWNPALYFQVCHGGFSGRFLRERTIAFTLKDRARKYDEIEWELDNGDGLLAAVEYLALGLTIRVRLGYLGATTPWRYFVINRVKGPVGIRDKTNTRGALAVRKPGRGDGRLIYTGRNRNAPVPKSPKKKKYAKPTSDLIGAELNSSNTLHKSRQVLGSTTSDCVREIARRNGFTGPYANIEPINDKPNGGGYTLKPGETDHKFLTRLARDKGVVFKVDRQGLHFHTDEWAGAVRGKIIRETFTYNGGPDILELGIDGDFRLPVPRKVSVHGYDPNTRQRGLIGHAESGARGNKNEFSSVAIRGMGAAGRILSGPVVDNRLLQMQERWENLTISEEVITVPNVLSEATDRARRQFEKRHLNSYKIRCRVVGNPAIAARDYVRLGGAGSKLIDGVWWVWEVKHIFSGETYVSDMTLKLPPKKVLDKIVRGAVYHREAMSRRNRREHTSVGIRGDIDSDPTRRINRNSTSVKRVSR
jgi:hypothetical protein